MIFKPLSLLSVLFLTACTQTHPSNFTVDLEPQVVNQQHAAELNVELGLAYLERRQVVKAKEKLNHAQQLAPNLSMTHYAMGYYWERVGELEQAEQEYQKAIRLHPAGQEYNNYGAYLCRAKRYSEAEQQFLKAIADPHYTKVASTFENAGLCAEKQGDQRKSKYYLEKASLMNP